MLARLDEPEPFVDASGDLCEDIGGIGVLQFGRLRAGVPCMFAKGDERGRKRIDMAVPICRCQQILIELLNRRLADVIDLQLQSRQAYWNVEGPHFMALRELFDKVAQGVEEYANLIAGRIVQLGGKAEGTVQTVAMRSSLDRYWLSTAEGNGHIDALSTTLTDFGRHAHYASAQASELNDADSAAILTEIGRGIDKWLWLVSTNQQSGS